MLNDIYVFVRDFVRRPWKRRSLKDESSKTIAPQKKQFDEQAKENLSRLPRVTDSEFRLACYDIADALAKNWAFKIQVIGGVIVISLAFLGLLGWTIANDARRQVEVRVAKEFEQDRIQKLVEAVAADRADELLKKSVQPSIDSTTVKLQEFDKYLMDQRKAIEVDVESIREEVAKLRKRNEIAALGDKAIAEGDVTAYQKLEELANANEGSDLSNAGLAELFRVFGAYSIFAPVRWGGISLIANTVNPKKTKEEELDSSDLFAILLSKESNPMAKARALSLLEKLDHPSSYKLAETLIEVLKNGKHLEVIKRIRYMMSNKVTGCPSSGRLDGREILEWWEKNKSELKEKDLDSRSVNPNGGS